MIRRVMLIMYSRYQMIDLVPSREIDHLAKILTFGNCMAACSSNFAPGIFRVAEGSGNFAPGIFRVVEGSGNFAHGIFRVVEGSG
ncbi:MAG TPA: hypothetical protein PK156_46220, partial [Polyangium sp.]|nr:hypothetical protein [Polyangium sp.]